MFGIFVKRYRDRSTLPKGWPIRMDQWLVAEVQVENLYCRLMSKERVDMSYSNPAQEGAFVYPSGSEFVNVNAGGMEFDLPAKLMGATIALIACDRMIEHLREFDIEGMRVWETQYTMLCHGLQSFSHEDHELARRFSDAVYCNN